MSKSTFKILFYLRKNYLNKEGKAGIMIRLSLNGEISQFSSKLDIEPDKWDTTLGKVYILIEKCTTTPIEKCTT